MILMQKWYLKKPSTLWIIWFLNLHNVREFLSNFINWTITTHIFNLYLNNDILYIIQTNWVLIFFFILIQTLVWLYNTKDHIKKSRKKIHVHNETHYVVPFTLSPIHTERKNIMLGKGVFRQDCQNNIQWVHNFSLTWWNISGVRKHGVDFVNVLNVTELYSLKWLLMCYVRIITIKQSLKLENQRRLLGVVRPIEKLVRYRVCPKHFIHWPCNGLM